MSGTERRRPIVVTGASGFIAKHVIAELLKRDFAVRGSLRDLEKAGSVRKAVIAAGADPAKLTFFAADLTKDQGWDDGINGAAAVMHIASPNPLHQPSNADDVIVPARDGTLRVMLAAHRGIVPRVVVTSAIGTVMYPANSKMGGTFRECDFTDETNLRLSPYIRSKTLAEKAAWTFIKTKLGAPELTVIVPAHVYGPALDDDLSASHELLVALAKGRVFAPSKIAFPVCDVRDLAAAHVDALLAPSAAGHRFIIAEGSVRTFEIGQTLAAELPDLRRLVPRREMSDVSVRLRAFTNRNLRTQLADVGCLRACCNQKARDFFGLTLRGADEAIRASAQSLRQLQLL
jgi:dihydroflavonol-4-reductase